MAKEPVVISLGGSIVITEAGVRVKFLREFFSVVRAEARRGRRFYIVVGGGNTARVYQAAGRKLNLPNRALDEIGICVTQVNAALVRELFAGVKNIFVCGGEKPGQSTDAVSVLLAKKNGAKKIINISNVAYIYDKDPAHFSQAKKFAALSWFEYLKFIPSRWEPGLHTPFDPVAARGAARAKLAVAFVTGDDLKSLRAVLENKKHAGSIIN